MYIFVTCLSPQPPFRCFCIVGDLFIYFAHWEGGGFIQLGNGAPHLRKRGRGKGEIPYQLKKKIEPQRGAGMCSFPPTLLRNNPVCDV